MATASDIEVVSAAEAGIDELKVRQFIEGLKDSRDFQVFGRLIHETEAGDLSLDDAGFDYCQPGWLDRRSTGLVIPPPLNPFTIPLHDYADDLAPIPLQLAPARQPYNHYALIYRSATGGSTRPAPRTSLGTPGVHAIVPLLGSVEIGYHGATHHIEQDEIIFVTARSQSDVPVFEAPAAAGYLALSLEARPEVPELVDA